MLCDDTYCGSASLQRCSSVREAASSLLKSSKCLPLVPHPCPRAFNGHRTNACLLRLVSMLSMAFT
eukprot:954897-Pelagomonas_calceolata.AAC.9